MSMLMPFFSSEERIPYDFGKHCGISMSFKKHENELSWLLPEIKIRFNNKYFIFLDCNEGFKPTTS